MSSDNERARAEREKAFAARVALRHPEDPEAAEVAREARALVVHWSDGDDLNGSHDDEEDEDR